MRNFAFPYFSRDIAEFWRRWHISLSTWLRDYIYVPLCGTKPSRMRKAGSIMTTFTACGLWHGANWTFILWGLLHGLYFLPLTLARRRKRFIGDAAQGRLLPSFTEIAYMLATFTMVGFGWIFFRSQSISDAFGYLGAMFGRSGIPLVNQSGLLVMILVCIILLLAEWFMRRKKHLLEIGDLPVAVRWSIYILVVTITLAGGVFEGNDFIYFQF
jgi:D-alanyl-lipoteichoic acid acyltransferase DltB (MBOAT superfamily)